MSNFFYRWLNSPLWLQGFSVSLLLSLLVVPIWSLWRMPVQQSGVKLSQQQRQQTGDYQRLTGALAAKVTLAAIETEIAQLRQASEPGHTIFSLQKLTEVSRSSLAEWQPAGQGGRLVLQLTWPQVQNVFGYLSSLSGVALPHFTLKPEKQQLRLQLSLAVKDEG